MDRTDRQPSRKIRKFIEPYAIAPATAPTIDEAVINPPGRKLDPLSRQAEEPKVVSNQAGHKEPSQAMLRTFELQQEINRRRGGKK